ncbi:AfsR/SARP family transcriptional regulator [Streptomyces axinellae]|uniref:AfsR/SARP family transcriptional regulator n=1 Tax=Streptomyces axinellae TaxID=552788 RepID=UPI003CD0853D
MRVRYLFRVLGTTQVFREDGTPVPVGGARLRALLTALALAGGRAVCTDTLAAAVWAEDEEPPADETGALQALVGRLRRSLGREAVASVEGGGYRLTAARDDIDLFRFERLTEEGTAALAEGEATKAAALLDDALALWRGPALADLPDGGGASGVRAADRQLTARRARAEADLALGRAEAVLPVVRQLAADHPLDEPLQALLLRALRDAGRPAEALEAYEGIRLRLADRLGADPGPELRALHAELLTGERPERPQPRPEGPQPRPEGPQAPGRDHRPATAPDPGDPRAVPDPGVPRAVPDPEPPRAARAPGNLRAALTSFVGRSEEIKDIGRELNSARLVTLTGPGGAGKTRLSLETAAGARDSSGTGWEDGVWVAELAPVRDPRHYQETAEAVLTALGGRETVLSGSTAESLRAATDPTATDPLAQLAERCANRRMLLVLDNCEHVIDAAARIVETLLVECPGVTVLATSREPLGVPGESVRPVEPLPDPFALQLLADRGASARAGFRIDEDPEACAEICRRLDGLPLAIELAAARLRSLTPGQLARRLDDRFRLLTSGSRTVLPRQQTLRAVVDWSWELLSEPERAVLRRLSVFAGGCRLEQAEEVCADIPDGAGHQIVALLGSLVDKSLVVAVPDPNGDGMRYRLLETVGEYAAGELDAVPGERQRAERRHLVAYRELARTADPLLRGPQQAVWLDRLEGEHDNIRSALRRALAARDEHEALCLVLSMGWFWQLRDHRSDARAWATAVAELGPDPFAAPVRPAPPLYERCTDAPPPLSEEMLWEARRGVRLMVLADAEDGVAELAAPGRQETLANIALAYTPGMPQTCRVPGCMWIFTWIMRGDFAGLSEVADRTVEGCRELGYEWELAFALRLRSKITGDSPRTWERSAADAAESLEIFRRAGDAWGEAEALSGRAESLTARGEFASAAADYRLAIERAEQLGAHSQVPQLKSRLGAVLVEMGDAGLTEEGDGLLREAVEQAGRLGGDAPTFAAIQLATRLARTGQTQQAREKLEPLAAQFADRAPELFSGMVQGLLGWTYALEGSPREALAKVREAIGKTRDPIARAIAPHLTLTQLLTAAQALASLDEPVTAARLLGVYDTQSSLPEGHFPHPVERDARKAAEAAAREALSEAAYAEAYAVGTSLPLAEAVTLLKAP